MIHINIATPMYRGECSGYYTESILDLVSECFNRGIGVSWQFLYNEANIAKGRNNLAHNFLKSDATHLLFIDADMKFRVEDILAMIQTDKSVIGAVCPKRNINWASIRQAVNNGVENLEKATGDFNFTPLSIQGPLRVIQNEPLEVAQVGTGIMLIKKEVFIKLVSVVRAFKMDSENIVSEFFKMEVKDDGSFTSEDYYFCDLCRNNNEQIFVAPWTQVGHHGSMLYQGTLF